MRTKIFRCPAIIYVVLGAGAMGMLFLSTDTGLVGLPNSFSRYFVGAASCIVLYGLTLAPGKVVVAEDGISQHLFLSKWRLPWAEMSEWRYDQSGVECEESHLRANSVGKLHSSFWIRDRAGNRHHLKTWLVFGRRSKQLADMIREKGIKGG
jgi:hypothetical protein